MSSFWIGVVITISTIIVTSLYTIISAENLYERYRTFLIWYPFNISIAFFSGFASFIHASNKNEFGKGAIAILLVILIAVISYIIEKNYFILKKEWENVNNERLKRLSLYFYIFSIIIGILPYFIFFNLTSRYLFILILLVFVSLLIIPLYLLAWDKIYTAAETDLGNKLVLILYSHNKFSFAFFNEDDYDKLLFHGDKSDLVYRLSKIEKALEHIHHFDPVLYDGNLMPGFKNNILSLKRIREITRYKLDELMKKYHDLRASMYILVGDEPHKVEGYDIIKKSKGIEYANLLLERRSELL